MQFIDCIEFSSRFRCSDVVEDIAFLAMDFDRYRRPDLSRTFVRQYLQEIKDEDGEGLLDFFKCYRAAVRGKVISFRLEGDDLDDRDRVRFLNQASAYFQLANSYAVNSLGRPFLIVFSGLMGSGKSVLASELSEHFQIPLVASDETRKQLAGLPTGRRQYVGFGEGIYSCAMSERTYDRLFQEASQLLDQGRSVILDASFSKARHRRIALRLAKESGGSFYLVHCQAPEKVLRSRLWQRSRGEVETVSDGRWELLQDQKRQWEPIPDNVPTIELETNRPIAESAAALLAALFELAQSGERETPSNNFVTYSA